MKPADIVVGKKYRHKNYTDTIYLGVGERSKYNHDIFERKKLIIFSSLNSVDVGAIVASPTSCTHKGFWNGFYPEN